MLAVTVCKVLLVQGLNMMELSTLLAGSGLLPRKSGGSMNKAQLVASLQAALKQNSSPQVCEVACMPSSVPLRPSCTWWMAQQHLPQHRHMRCRQQGAD